VRAAELMRKWTNPLEVRLPDARDMKVYCLYGHGKETEVSDRSLPVAFIGREGSS
jgi:hypothetical protein